MTNPADGSASTPPHGSSNTSNRTLPILIGIVVAGVIIAVGSYLGLKSGANDVADRLLPSQDPGIVASQVPGVISPELSGASQRDFSEVDPTALTVDQFYDDSVYPESYRIKWANKVIQERTTPELLRKISSLLASGKRDPLGPLVPASVDNTGDEILTQQTVANFIASTASTPDEGRKLLAGLVSPNNSEFSTASGQLGSNQDPVLATYYVAAESNNYSQKMESPVFSQTATGDYVPGGRPSKIMTVINSFDGKVSQITEKFEEGRWILVTTIGFPNKNWIPHPSEINNK